MLSDERNLPANVSTDPYMQAFATGVFDQLDDCLTYVSQTGDLTTPGSVTNPGFANTMVGFRCYKFNDPLATSLDIFLRVDVGTGTADYREPGVKVAVGLTLNGSGTLSGTYKTASTLTASALYKTGGTDAPSYMSHGAGYFHWVWNVDQADARFGAAIVVERPFNNGAATSEGFLFWARSSAGGHRQFISPTDAPSVFSGDEAYIGPVSTGFVTETFSRKQLWPLFYPTAISTRHTRCAIYKHANIPALSELTGGDAVSWFGGSTGFKTIGGTALNRVTANSGPDGLAIGWES